VSFASQTGVPHNDANFGIGTLVVKFNPARALYQRLGFRIVGEDAHKLYLRRDWAGA
jgi:ribosomal protein S18 acetylase RimI-like enzyme